MSSDSRLVAAIVVDASQAIAPAKSAGDAMVDALKRTEEQNRKLEETEKKLTAAMQTKLSASKQVELALGAQAAAGKPLEEELVRLQERYARLDAAMRNAARGGRGVPTELAAEAQRVRTEIAAVESQITRASGASSGLGSALSGLPGPLGMLSASTLGAGVAIAGMTRFMTSAIASASESEAVTRRLVAALEAQGRSYQEAAGIQAYSSALEKQSAFSDEAITGVQTQLIQLSQLSSQALPGATKAVLDYAAATGSDLNSAVVQVSKAINGHGEGLNKVGVQYKAVGDKTRDTAGVIAALESKFGGQAAAATETFAGKTAQLANQWDNLKEIVGGEVLPVLTDLFGGITDGIEEVIHLSDSNSVLAKSFADIGSFGIIPALKAYREWRAALDENDTNKSIAAAQLKEESAALAAIRTRMEELRPIVQDYQDKVDMQYTSYTSKLKQAREELEKLKKEEIDEAKIVAGMQKRVDDFAKPKTDQGPTKTPEELAKEAEKAARERERAEEVVARAVERAAKLRADALMHEGSATDALSAQIASLESQRNRELAAAERETDPQEQDRKGAVAVATQQKIDALKAEQAQQKLTEAARRESIRADVEEHAAASPLEQKLNDLRRARLELAKAIEIQAAAENRGHTTAEEQARLAAIDNEIDATKKLAAENKKAGDEAESAGRRTEQAYARAGAAMATSVGTALGQIAAGHKKVSDVILQTVTQMALREISAAAGVAAAKAIEANAGLGAIGLPIGIATAAAFVSAILAEKKFVGAATGGKLRGGIPGRDSIPVMAMEDENVLDVRTNRRLEAFLDRAERGLQTSAPSRIPLELNVHLPEGIPGVGPTPGELYAAIDRHIVPKILQAIDDGRFDDALRGRSL